MDRDSLLDLLKVRFNLVLELVSLLAFPTLVDTTTVFANKVLSMLLGVLGLVVFCLVHGDQTKWDKRVTMTLFQGIDIASVAML